jgi:hypothetical protein
MLNFFAEDVDDPVVRDRILAVRLLCQPVVNLDRAAFGFDHRFDDGLEILYCFLLKVIRVSSVSRTWDTSHPHSSGLLRGEPCAHTWDRHSCHPVLSQACFHHLDHVRRPTDRVHHGIIDQTCSHLHSYLCAPSSPTVITASTMPKHPAASPTALNDVLADHSCGRGPGPR